MKLKSCQKRWFTPHTRGCTAGNRKLDKNIEHALFQKIAYLLQHGKKVKLGYKFKLHHYGPHCPELWSDLNYLANQNIINVYAKSNGYGYKISSRKDSNSRFLLNKLDERIKKKATLLLKLLSHNPTEELKVMATLHYIYCDFEKKRQKYFG